MQIKDVCCLHFTSHTDDVVIVVSNGNNGYQKYQGDEQLGRLSMSAQMKWKYRIIDIVL